MSKVTYLSSLAINKVVYLSILSISKVVYLSSLFIHKVTYFLGTAYWTSAMKQTEICFSEHTMLPNVFFNNNLF